jgi:hypothetical protein
MSLSKKAEIKRIEVPSQPQQKKDISKEKSWMTCACHHSYDRKQKIGYPGQASLGKK